MQGIRGAVPQDLAAIQALLLPLEQRGILAPRTDAQLLSDLRFFRVAERDANVSTHVPARISSTFRKLPRCSQDARLHNRSCGSACRWLAQDLLAVLKPEYVKSTTALATHAPCLRASCQASLASQSCKCMRSCPALLVEYGQTPNAALDKHNEHVHHHQNPKWSVGVVAGAGMCHGEAPRRRL